MAELNGLPVAAEQLQALALTNYGHFTTLRVDDGRVRGFSLHLERLERDCRTLFGVDLDPARVRALVRRMVPDRGAAVIRVTVFDPAIDIGRPERAVDPQVLVVRRAAGTLSPPPLSVSSTRYVRDVPQVKGVGLFGALHQRRAARLGGFDDALFVTPDGLVSEGGTWNIGFHDGERVVWPEADCLPGITMRLLQGARDHRVAPVPLADVPSMRAAFATNAAVGVRAISRIDGTELPGDHPVLDSLRQAYAEVAAEPV
ncbi:aminotransferase class IV family protein [Streptomyces sp. NPDC020965]|uniref:aminotransferase class IV family protein n=1 Tax=Streptomyces sp. NPDC020965 TaxID=3365105 RepID=UPI00378F6243